MFLRIPDLNMSKNYVLNFQARDIGNTQVLEWIFATDFCFLFFLCIPCFQVNFFPKLPFVDFVILIFLCLQPCTLLILQELYYLYKSLNIKQCTVVFLQ